MKISYYCTIFGAIFSRIFEITITGCSPIILCFFSLNFLQPPVLHNHLRHVMASPLTLPTYIQKALRECNCLSFLVRSITLASSWSLLQLTLAIGLKDIWFTKLCQKQSMATIVLAVLGGIYKTTTKKTQSLLTNCVIILTPEPKVNLTSEKALSNRGDSQLTLSVREEK